MRYVNDSPHKCRNPNCVCVRGVHLLNINNTVYA